MLHEIANQIIHLAAAGAVTAISVYLPLFLSAIAKHVKNAMLAHALQLASVAAANAVQAQAARVRDLKDPTKPGTWSKEAVELVLRDALADAKAQAPLAVATIEQSLTKGQSVDSVMQSLIENAVETTRQRAKETGATS